MHACVLQVRHLSFGTYFPGMHNPLDNTSKHSAEGAAEERPISTPLTVHLVCVSSPSLPFDSTCHPMASVQARYMIKVVPSTYAAINGSARPSNLFS